MPRKQTKKIRFAKEQLKKRLKGMGLEVSVGIVAPKTENENFKLLVRAWGGTLVAIRRKVGQKYYGFTVVYQEIFPIDLRNTFTF